MAKKILYLGNGKWCYTENCQEHASLHKAHSSLLEALDKQDTEEINKQIELLNNLAEGPAVLYYTRTKLLSQKLNRTPVIGLDVDNTTGDFNNAFRNFLLNSEGFKVSKEAWEAALPPLSTYDFHGSENAWFESKEDFVESFTAAEQEGLYLNLNIYDNASETIQELKNYGFDIKVITARNAVFNKHTSEWFKKHLGKMPRIYNAGKNKEKVENVDVYIEDSPEVIQRLIRNKKNVLVMDQPYNRDLPIREGKIDRTIGWTDKMVEQIFDLASNTRHNER